MIYQSVLRPLLFRMDPEHAHELALALLAAAQRLPGAVRLLAGGGNPDPALAVDVLGMRFPNPVGLAAGFDKNGRVPWALTALGFGAVELGGVLAAPTPGNPRPRIARRPADQALVNWMGLPNDGAAMVARRLAAAGLPGKPVGVRPRFGLNVAGERVEDYLAVLTQCAPFVDYATLNVSCPNVPAGRQLREPAQIRALLAALRADPAVSRVPALLKLSPDLDEHDLESLVQIALEGGAAGIVATNTSAQLAGERGGLSGAPLRELSTSVIRRVRRLAGDRLAIIGVGGVFTAADAWEKLAAGASLVQVYTGFVYRGPAIAREVNAGLARLLRERGFERLGDVVGSEAAAAGRSHRTVDALA